MNGTHEGHPHGASNSLYDSAVEGIIVAQGSWGNSPFCSRYDVACNFCVKHRSRFFFKFRQLETFAWKVSLCLPSQSILFFLTVEHLMNIYILIFLIYVVSPREFINSKPKDRSKSSSEVDDSSRFHLAYANRQQNVLKNAKARVRRKQKPRAILITR